MLDNIQWLLDSGEPWTQYRTYLDLVGKKVADTDVCQAREVMLSHPLVHSLIVASAHWITTPMKRHNDAAHPLYQMGVLADFGVCYTDAGLRTIIDTILQHQSNEGAFQTLLNIHPRYGGTGENTWSWMNCDAPTLLYILLKMGVPDGYKTKIHQAVVHLEEGVYDNGWRCRAAHEFGDFRGPGRKDDPCPIATVYALKALIQFPELHQSDAVQNGADMLLWHWGHQKERKFYLFGIGTDFRKLKYPLIWYDILHVVEILSQLDYVRDDIRFREMVTEITLQADTDNRFTASSMYQAWKGWSFADKKRPSPWLTFLVLRILKRLQ
jgi:hypothetical protein